MVRDDGGWGARAITTNARCTGGGGEGSGAELLCHVLDELVESGAARHTFEVWRGTVLVSRGLEEGAQILDVLLFILRGARLGRFATEGRAGLDASCRVVRVETSARVAAAALAHDRRLLLLREGKR